MDLIWGLDLQKVSGWIGSTESNLSRGFSRKDVRHKIGPIDSKILQGVPCKNSFLLPWDQTGAGGIPPAALELLDSGGSGG
jgi:hypothetical protein